MWKYSSEETEYSRLCYENCTGNPSQKCGDTFLLLMNVYSSADPTTTVTTTATTVTTTVTTTIPVGKAQFLKSSWLIFL